MKKITIFITAVLAMASVSCTKDGIKQDASPSGIKLNITVAGIDGTKAAKTAWTEGDKINVWFETSFDPAFVLTFNGSEWTGKLTVTPESEGRMWCMYESNNDLTSLDTSASDWDSRSLVFKPRRKSGDDSPAATPLICYSIDDYTFSDNTFTATIEDWVFCTSVQVVVSGLDGDKADDYSLSCDKFTPFNSLTFDLNGGVESYGRGTGKPVLGISNEDGAAFCFYTTTTSEEAQDYTFTLRHYDTDGSVDWMKRYKVNNSLEEASIRFIKIAESKFEDPYPAGAAVHVGYRDGIVVDFGGKIGKMVVATMNEGAYTETAFGSYYTYTEAMNVENGEGWDGDWKMMTKEMLDVLASLPNSHCSDDGKEGRTWIIGSSTLFIPYAGYYYPGIGVDWEKTNEGKVFKVWSSSMIPYDTEMPKEYWSYYYYYLESGESYIRTEENGNPNWYRGSVRLCHELPTD